MIPSGICVDLETTIAGKVPDTIQPPGQKRYETRIIEIGAVEWKTPTRTFGCLVNPIPASAAIHSVEDLFAWLTKHHQKPSSTLNFWSKVLVKRKSVLRTMFRHKEDPLVWLNRTVQNRAIDFVHWHNHPNDGPEFVTEEVGLRKLLAFGAGKDWLAHNGKSFDYKVLQGCALRTGLPIPCSIQQHDTLHLFRKYIPGHTSYSQPKLYSALFNETYNAHVAIDDAKALTRLCQHVDAAAPQRGAPRPTTRPTTASRPTTTPKYNRMNLQFTIKHPPPTTYSKIPSKIPSKILSKIPSKIPSTLIKIKGIGPKSVAALTLLNITSVDQLQAKLNKHGSEWLRDNLPFGVNWKKVSKEII
tara:strand:+ start:328 stop:1401 length:1074 start_codon:yes stop_codon:yes gene_type:complete